MVSAPCFMEEAYIVHQYLIPPLGILFSQQVPRLLYALLLLLYVLLDFCISFLGVRDHRRST